MRLTQGPSPAAPADAVRNSPPMDRNTTQRNAIRHALQETGRPLSPQEILETAQADVPGLGIATVYRTIKSLVAEGWLVPVELPGEPARYELSRIAHHHH